MAAKRLFVLLPTSDAEYFGALVFAYAWKGNKAKELVGPAMKPGGRYWSFFTVTWMIALSTL